ncbi:hypothetical protein [Apilactobacillus micheneri]|uniref:hypothetical protein n=1 Tax=Apilactobacillus micheneri TaxID=1899430 RepID=UPI00112832F7|nr:hypothetical protein [Apilactobacillus micheneri]
MKEEKQMKKTDEQIDKKIDEQIKKYIKIKFKKHSKVIYFVAAILILVSIYVIFFNKTSNVYIKSKAENSDVMSLLMNEMSSMNSRISSEIGWIMTIVSIIMGAVGFYSYNQWKMSANQIDNLREEFKDQFHIEFIQNTIKDIKSKSAIQDENMNRSKSLNNKLRNKIKEVEGKVEEVDDVLERDRIKMRMDEFYRLSEKNYSEKDAYTIYFDISRMEDYLNDIEGDAKKIDKLDVLIIISNINIVFLSIIESETEKIDFKEGTIEQIEQIVEHVENICDEFNDPKVNEREKRLKEYYAKIIEKAGEIEGGK